MVAKEHHVLLDGARLSLHEKQDKPEDDEVEGEKPVDVVLERPQID